MNEKQVIERATKDAAFRQRLMTDPMATLESTGIRVPAGMSVRVVEDTASLIHIVLPSVGAHEAIPDHELEAVAGGRCIGTENR